MKDPVSGVTCFENSAVVDVFLEIFDSSVSAIVETNSSAKFCCVEDFPYPIETQSHRQFYLKWLETT